VLSLPLWSQIREDQQLRVVEAVRRFAAE